MAVDQPDVVDFIGVAKATGAVVLTVADHLEFDSDGDHLLILQEKLNRYLAFIESGEVHQAFPMSIGRETVISIHFKYRPDALALEFLGMAQRAIRDAGFALEWLVPDADADPNDA